MWYNIITILIEVIKMENKKFYQNYTLQTEEEVLTLMALLLKDGIGFYMDEMSSNFVQEKVADKDPADFSCSYLITEDIDRLIDGWIDTYDTAKDLLDAKQVDEDFINNSIKKLYINMVGGKDFNELLRKDKETFGSYVNFYDTDSFVNMFKLLS